MEPIMQNVTFPTDNQVAIAGHLYQPEGFDPNGSYAAIVVAHPGGGVKEQAAGLYARKLAEQGFVTLAFDASYQGESGGEPRFLEDPNARVEDIRAAVDYLQSLEYVNEERIGALGICAGGAYTVNAAMTDYRIKALTTVSAFNIGTAFRRGYVGTGTGSDAQALLKDLAAQRTAESAKGNESVYWPSVPTKVDENTIRDMREAHEYYLTPRAQHPNAENKILFTKSWSRILNFDAFHPVEDLLIQPLLIVAGSEAGSLWHSTELHARVRSPKKLVLLEGCSHIDLYDIPQAVKQAIAEAAAFFNEHLAG